MKETTLFGSALFVVISLLLTSIGYAQQSRQIPFVATTEPISMNGILDDAAWAAAPVIADFIQAAPYEGTIAVKKTEARILFGENALFVGAKMYEQDSLIEDNAGPRDAYNRADWFMVSLDGYFNKKTAFTFAVNAAGVQLDGQQDDNKKLAVFDKDPLLPDGLDVSWNAIWSSAVARFEDGWGVEMRIPYSMLRFSEKNDAESWGIYFNRRVPGTGEVSEWPYIPRNVRMNLVANYGQITGIKNIRPRKNIQLRPYVLAGLNSFENPEKPGHASFDSRYNAGGDIKVSIGSGATIDATFNPDFGQVEADPAVLNLTAFATFFPEKRPFFLEGADIFKFGIGSSRLFYSRRLGAENPIISAAKLSGNTKKGLSYGVLGATEGSKLRLSKNYGVVRASQRIGQYSSLGGMMTYFNSPSGSGTGWRSLTGGLDWDLHFDNNRYSFEGIATFSDRTPLVSGKEREKGFMTGLVLRKTKGRLDGHTTILLFSDKYNPNDVGWISYEQNWYQLWVNANYKLNDGKPFGKFQRGDLKFGMNQRVSFLELYNMGWDFGITPVVTTRSFESLMFGGHVYDIFGGYDLWETRGLGIWGKPAVFEVMAEYGTDSRKRWQLIPGADVRVSTLHGKEYEVYLNSNFSIGRRVSLRANLAANVERNKTAWASNETFARTNTGWEIGNISASPDDIPAQEYAGMSDYGNLNTILQQAKEYRAGSGQYYVPVFGARNTNSLDLTIRGTLSFGGKFSIQQYLQFFVAKGVYNKPAILVDPDHLVDFPEYPKERSFNYKNLQSNFVARWEYRPGSNIYLVWTHSRNRRQDMNPLAPRIDEVYKQNTWEQFSDIFRIFPANGIMLKIDYVLY